MASLFSKILIALTASLLTFTFSSCTVREPFPPTNVTQLPAQTHPTSGYQPAAIAPSVDPTWN